MKNIILILVLLATGTVMAQSGTGKTFSNPLLPSGADPWSFYKDGYYYYMHTVGNRLDLWKTNDLAELPSAERKTVFKPTPGTEYSKSIWAPEIHFLHGKWYIYFAAANANNRNNRMYVLENASPDPMAGEWVFKGKIAAPSDKWAIDGSVFEYSNQLYFIWSGWEGNTNVRQDIYMAKMKNPWAIEGERVRISSPQLSWEMYGEQKSPQGSKYVYVNEGPQALFNKDKLFIVYSASGCWTDNYALGLLEFTGSKNLLDSASWKKHEKPLFSTSEKNQVYGPGHNSFFTSPDGKTNYILYHANSKPGQGCGRFRSPRAQQFTWNADGTPFFGEPLPLD